MTGRGASVQDVASRVIEAWDFSEPVRLRVNRVGLINQTFMIDGLSGPLGVLQCLNTSVFCPEVHEDIEAVSRHLMARGVSTPTLMRTRSDALWHVDDGGGVWRILSHVGDRTTSQLQMPDEAQSVGELVATFHRALSDFSWTFRSVRHGAHDTAAHMKTLERALERHSRHRLIEPVRRLAEQVLWGWAHWEGSLDSPQRVIHGDLKVNNIRFEGPRALCLVDLDTLGRGTLQVELGDALRSWCNTAAEEAMSPRIAWPIFQAATRGYASAIGDALSPGEWEGVVPGWERICWELAARFAADALEESYFGWDDQRFGSRGEHNLQRARGQAALAAAVREERPRAEEWMSDMSRVIEG